MTILRKIWHSVVRSVSETAFVWINEINMAFRDEAVLVFMVLVPLGYPLLYSYIYDNEVVRDIPVAVVDESQSVLSREYTRKLDAAELTNVAERPADLMAAREMMRQQKVFGIIEIPSDFSRKIQRGEKAYVFAFSDASTLLYYRQIAVANTEVSLQMNAEIKIARGGGTTGRQDELVAAPVKYEEVNIYNPTLGMAAFLLPAVLMLILQQTMLLGVGINAGTMREKDAFRLFAPIARHAGGTLEIVLGRSLCYLPLYTANAVYVLGITPMIFRFNRLEHLADVVVFMVPYLLAISFFAQCVSHLVRKRESSMLIILFSSLIFLFVSGISWPWFAVPKFWKTVGCLIPSTYGINGFVRMSNEGASLAQVATEYRALWILALAYLLLATRLMKLEIRESSRHFRQRQRAGRHRRTAPAIATAAAATPAADTSADASADTQGEASQPESTADQNPQTSQPAQ